MGYDQVLKELESAIKEADQLEEQFDESKESIEMLEKVRSRAKDSGLTFSDSLYIDAKAKFDSGDYEEAGNTARSCSQELDDCCSNFSELSTSFKKSDGFDIKSKKGWY